MSLVLKNQLDASERSVQEIEEKLLQESRRAVVAQDVQELALSLVQMYEDVCAQVERWQKRAPVDNAKLIDAERFAVFERLEALFARTSGLARRSEESGYASDNDEFARTWRKLRALVSFPLEDVQKAFDQVNRGETRSLGEVRDELRDSTIH